MRAPAFFLAGSLAVATACSSPAPVPDAGGGDAGPTADAGSDAGAGPICLADTVDAGATDAGWDGGLDFSCRGRAAPSGGQAELQISGTVTKAGFTRTPMPDILVDLLRADGTVLASTTSGDGGVYALKFDAGCAPLTGEVRATFPSPDAGYYLSYSVPAAPWIRDRESLELILFDLSTANLVAAIANVAISDGGVLALHVADCAGNPVEGATVSLSGDAGVVRYVGATGLPSSALTATSSSADVLIFNLPGSSVEVTASLDGGVIGRRVVPLHTGAVSGTTLLP